MNPTYTSPTRSNPNYQVTPTNPDLGMRRRNPHGQPLNLNGAFNNAAGDVQPAEVRTQTIGQKALIAVGCLLAIGIVIGGTLYATNPNVRNQVHALGSAIGTAFSSSSPSNPAEDLVSDLNRNISTLTKNLETIDRNCQNPAHQAQCATEEFQNMRANIIQSLNFAKDALNATSSSNSSLSATLLKETNYTAS